MCYKYLTHITQTLNTEHKMLYQDFLLALGQPIDIPKEIIDHSMENIVQKRIHYYEGEFFVEENVKIVEGETCAFSNAFLSALHKVQNQTQLAQDLRFQENRIMRDCANRLAYEKEKSKITLLLGLSTVFFAGLFVGSVFLNTGYVISENAIGSLIGYIETHFDKKGD